MLGQLVMVGVSHTGSEQELLESTALRPADLPHLLDGLRAAGYVEAVALSTCSRTELYAVTRPGRPGVASLVEVLLGRANIGHAAAASAFEARGGSAVVEHLFRVTAGLESRVVGEADVQLQVQRAFRVAQTVGTIGPLFQRLIPAALRSAERAHAHAELGRLNRSLARRAVDIGLEGLVEERSPRTLVVGSGQMAAAALTRLAELGLPARVAARNELYAAKLADPDAVCSLDALVSEIRQADLLICATSAAEPVVTAGHVHAAMMGRAKTLTVVDLSVPRNVDPAVERAKRVRVVELAALHDDARNDPATLAALEQAQYVVAAAASRLVDDLAARAAGPLIQALREQVRQECRDELLRRQPDLPPEAADRAAHVNAGRLLHAPTVALRTAAATGDHTTLARLARSFGLSVQSVG
ncbi:glutamyl-tRNA reductase [Terrabacter sp. 2RAF25]|uniref:glutamyl-tRNA reductase n=1 Tax=Terrabacter sp. 2RAF25 TaxID=3232998 RepID=UPI003F94F5E7